MIQAFVGGMLAALGFLWDSLFGLVFGFLVSAIVQVAVTPAAMHRYLGPNLRGLLYATGFGIISSACSYGAAAAARGFYQKGADIRSVFAFLVSSTNMNLAIVILFWTMLGWRFAFAEFFGGIIIIAIVTVGLRLLLGPSELNRLRHEHPVPGVAPTAGSAVHECPACGMEGEERYAVTHRDVSYWACSANHQADVQRDLEDNVESDQSAASGAPGWAALRRASTWSQIASTARNDVRMLRTELVVGYLIAGYAAALIPPGALAHTLHAVGAVPGIGYVLLLAVGLLVAVATFVCSMGNVPVARYLAAAGIPLGANTSFIYGDLLILPLLAIYRKSFPPRVMWTFVGLFAVGAMAAGAIMELVIGNGGTNAVASMAINERFTVISNGVALVAVIAVAAAANRGRRQASMAAVGEGGG